MNSIVFYGIVGLAAIGIGAFLVSAIEQIAAEERQEAGVTYDEWNALYGIEVDADGDGGD